MEFVSGHVLEGCSSRGGFIKSHKDAHKEVKMSRASKLSQAEYLQKYLSKNGDDKKKKRKIVHCRVKIIDDDINDFKYLENMGEEEIISSLMSQKDAPQIVMIDNHLPTNFNNKQRWKQIVPDSIEESESQVQKKEIDIDSRTSRKRKSGEENYHKSRNHSDSDLSPPRFKSKKSYKDDSTWDKRSERDKRRNSSDSDLSPPRFKSNNKSNLISSRAAEKEREPKKVKKTLDGTSAGLQNIKSLKEEEEAKKRRENEMMEKMSREMSGYGQSTVVRDRKTGRKRNLEREAEYHHEKQQEQEEINAKYAQWGRGLKQSDDHMSKLQQDLKEMDKPFARYADDEDLEKELKSCDRDDDPMLAYIKEKEIKEGKRAPSYSGSFMPNRFGIKPGFRWDGVDRSNGYENKWFEQQNMKKAVKEEAYKWSIADIFVPDKEFSGTDRTGSARSGPVQFEKEEEVPFGLSKFLKQAKRASSSGTSSKRKDDDRDKRDSKKRKH